MRKGFTMIELIFVIVILGVLASVAIPRLAATRDDAELSKAATNITIAVSDMAAYYTAQGTFDTADLSKMTNALNVGTTKTQGTIDVGKKTCATITVDNDNGLIKIAKSETDAICKTFWGMNGVKGICQDVAATGGTAASCNVKVGGSSIYNIDTTKPNAGTRP